MDFYLVTNKSYDAYITTTEPKVYSYYFYTNRSYDSYFITESPQTYSYYFYTNRAFSFPFITESPIRYSFTFYTNKTQGFYFVTEDNISDNYPNICSYPSILENIRYNATKLYYDLSIDNLRKSINNESYGKESTSGYLEVGHLRILIDFLSSIYLEKEQDSLSGISREDNYFYTKYKLEDITNNFKKCHINIKPIVDLFNLNTYTLTYP